jgi:hypothetical protein
MVGRSETVISATLSTASIDHAFYYLEAVKRILDASTSIEDAIMDGHKTDTWSMIIIIYPECDILNARKPQGGRLAGVEKMETEPIYRVCITWNGAAEDPANNEFDDFNEAVEMFNAEVANAEREIVEYESLWGERPEVEITIYDTFECQNKDHWSSEDDL